MADGIGPNVWATSALGNNVINPANRFAIDTTKTYLFEVWIRCLAATTTNAFSIARFFDAAGAPITTSGAGWPGSNAAAGNHYLPAVGTVPATAWTRHTLSVGPDGTGQFPAGAVSCALGGYMNYGSGTAVETQFGMLRVTEMSRGELIVDGAITAAKVAAKTITAAQIATGTISAAEIAANAITTAKISANAVTATQIASGTITAAEIATGAITTTKIAANAVTAATIAAGTITAAEIASNAITAAKIAVGAVTASHIAAGAVTAASIGAGTLSSNVVYAGSINASQLDAGIITGRRFRTASSGSRVEILTLSDGGVPDIVAYEASTLLFRVSPTSGAAVVYAKARTGGVAMQAENSEDTAALQARNTGAGSAVTAINTSSGPALQTQASSGPDIKLTARSSVPAAVAGGICYHSTHKFIFSDGSGWFKPTWTAV